MTERRSSPNPNPNAGRVPSELVRPPMRPGPNMEWFLLGEPLGSINTAGDTASDLARYDPAIAWPWQCTGPSNLPLTKYGAVDTQVNIYRRECGTGYWGHGIIGEWILAERIWDGTGHRWVAATCGASSWNGFLADTDPVAGAETISGNQIKQFTVAAGWTVYATVYARLSLALRSLFGSESYAYSGAMQIVWDGKYGWVILAAEIREKIGV